MKGDHICRTGVFAQTGDQPGPHSLPVIKTAQPSMCYHEGLQFYYAVPNHLPGVLASNLGFFHFRTGIQKLSPRNVSACHLKADENWCKLCSACLQVVCWTHLKSLFKWGAFFFAILSITAEVMIRVPEDRIQTINSFWIKPKIHSCQWKSPNQVQIEPAVCGRALSYWQA